MVWVRFALVSAWALATFGIPFLMVTSQAYDWLQHGYWTPYTLGEMIDNMGRVAPSTSMVGAQKIIDWTLGAPASLSIVCAGGAVMFACLAIAKND